MSVWLYCVHVNVNGQEIRVGDDLLLRTRRNVDVLLAESQHCRCQTRKFRGEVQTNLDLNVLDFSGRPEMQLNHHVAAGLQWPGQIRRHRWKLSGRPTEEVSIGKSRRRWN